MLNLPLEPTGCWGLCKGGGEGKAHTCSCRRHHLRDCHQDRSRVWASRRLLGRERWVRCHRNDLEWVVLVISVEFRSDTAHRTVRGALASSRGQGKAIAMPSPVEGRCRLQSGWE